MKRSRLVQTGKDGHCPGPGFDDIPECPFVEDMKSFRQSLNTRVYDSRLEKEKLAMLLYDGDHVDKLTKHLSGKRWAQEEFLLCIIRCCGCHQAKSLLNGEVGVHNWVVVSSDGNPVAPVHEREVNGEPMKLWNMEWRAASF